MKNLPLLSSNKMASRFVYLETCRLPESSPEVTPEQEYARGQILELLVVEISKARPGFMETDNFIETDDPETGGISIQDVQSDPHWDPRARDPENPYRAARIKEPGEIIIDQSTGLGQYTDDIVVLGDLDPELLAQSGFAEKPELVEWLRGELAYATEVANARLGVEGELLEVTPGASWENILSKGPAVRFSAKQTMILTAQANMMTLPSDLAWLETSKAAGRLNEEDLEAVAQKVQQITEAGFECSTQLARLENLQS